MSGSREEAKKIVSELITALDRKPRDAMEVVEKLDACFETGSNRQVFVKDNIKKYLGPSIENYNELRRGTGDSGLTYTHVKQLQAMSGPGLSSTLSQGLNELINLAKVNIEYFIKHAPEDPKALEGYRKAAASAPVRNQKQDAKKAEEERWSKESSRSMSTSSGEDSEDQKRSSRYSSGSTLFASSAEDDGMNLDDMLDDMKGEESDKSPKSKK